MTHNPHRVRHVLQYCAQLVILIVSRIIFFVFTDRQIDPQLRQRSLRGPFILVSNHNKASDPYIVGSSLPVNTFAHIAPIGFMTKNIFYDSPLRPILFVSGCYPSRNNKRGTHKIFGVEGSITLLKNGFSMFIFPEGTRVRGAERGPAHSGVLRIHKATPDIGILLCHISRNSWATALKTGKRWRVAYSLKRTPTYETAESIMDELFAL